MPLSRRRSCQQCVRAKARCSLERVCLRCARRGLTCDYAGTATVTSSSSARPFSSSSHTPRAQPSDFRLEELIAENLYDDTSSGFLAGPIDTQATEQVPLHQAPDRPPSFSGDTTGDFGIPLDYLSWPNPEWGGDDAQSAPSGIVTPSAPSMSRTISSRQNSRPGWGPQHKRSLNASSLNNSIRPLVDVSETITNFPPLCHSPALNHWRPDSRVVVYSRTGANILARRKAVAPEIYFTTQMLLGQIRNYPRMLSQGERLPPFIHPHCVLEGTPIRECCAQGMHQCLSEPLANCASLLHMYHGRNSGNSRFIWDAIYAEQRRLFKEYATYDQETLLAAIQAMTIYRLLQARDLEEATYSDIASMFVPLAEMSKLSFSSEIFADQLSGNTRLTRRSWVLVESLRRTFVLLFILQLIIDVLMDNTEDPDCTRFYSIPLPCVRELWDWSDYTGESWASRVQRHVDARVTDQVLLVGDLILGPYTHTHTHHHDMRGAETAVDDNNDEDGQKRTKALENLGLWCEGVDDFGMLVWTALRLDRMTREDKGNSVRQ
ncbi:hypothetical protein F4778DRAFT_335773 [Xylariomycetidae sp. FL2044]|nr:hypothetical protein F4778DRAFT_335773 [Xylariomycetidae sp. FL2044]